MSEDFTVQEKVFACSWLIAFESYQKTAQKFEESFFKPAPSKSTLYYLKDRFIETGSVIHDRQRTGRPISARGDEQVNEVKQVITDQLGISTRRISDWTGISRTSVRRILHEDLNAKPWKPTYSQELHDGDEDRRLQFCEKIQQEINNDINYLRKLTFSDECTFHLSGHVNKHNLVYWASENPQIRHTIKGGKSKSISVWALLGYRGLIDFEIVEDTVNGNRYCDILCKKVLPFFTRPINRTMIFQQDGAPAHYCLEARKLLDQNLQGRWIGRRGNIEWPARSPDLSVCDFWLWSFLRDRVYADNRIFETIEELKERVARELQAIPADVCSKAFKNFQNRLSRCIDLNGFHFE